MGRESSQQKIDRMRRPRVHITYDVEIGGAKQVRELPFVVGVLADLSGNPAEPLPKLKDRKFIDINRENFDTILAGMKPRLTFQVENTLQRDGTRIPVELHFQDMDDFSPEKVAMQVRPLRELLEARKRLSNLLDKMDSNEKLEPVLQKIVANTDSMKKLRSETGRDRQPSEGNDL